ncbi:hypothetical protein NEHOM01_0577 [Nematocida homosporus]|uniref:uncharacterized protein n=1 Tax=Nematocida homosporus TaxID=1912981 RepID=UPI00221FA021|nr:uncharacterized protein NEHOM01_0577 [Nematocida homosporus]KAI5185072.1 hypothetical protein NEHOM01_0577 [Nematocida homosporus]
MRDRFRTLNGLMGCLVSLYANSDLGRPLRLRSKSTFEFLQRFCHLTHLGLGLSLVTFGLGLVLRCLKRNGKEVGVWESFYRDLLAITVTVESFIPLIFWILWSIDAGSVVTRDNYIGEDTISMFFNLCMHGIPSVFLLVEFFLGEFVPARSHYLELGCFFLIYLGIMQGVYWATGRWPYQVVGYFTGWWRVFFFANCLVTLIGIYWMLTRMHARVWRPASRKYRRPAKRPSSGRKNK